MVSGAPRDYVFVPMLLILCTFKLFHIVGNNIVGYADETTFYAAVPRPLFPPQDGIAESLFGGKRLLVFEIVHEAQSQDKYMTINRSRSYAPDFGDLTLGSAELIKSLYILGVALDSKSRFEIHLRELSVSMQ